MAGEEAAFGVVLFLMFIIVLCVILGLLATVFWIWMIIDCAKRKFTNETTKIIWILVLVFLHWVGAAVYYFAIKRPGDQHAAPALKARPAKKSRKSVKKKASKK